MRTARTSRFDLARYARQAASRIRSGRTSSRRDARAVIEPVEGRQLMTVSIADAVTYDIPSLYDTESVVTGDFNGDGKLDVAGSSWADSKVYIMYGDGAGALTYGTSINTGPRTRDMVAADFNGDGKMDLAVSVQNVQGDTDDDEVQVLLSNGNGTFQSAIHVETDGIEVYDIAAGDLNGDNRPDLVVGHEWLNNTKLGILLNTGDGHFGQMATKNFSSGIRDIAIGDINNDGHKDIVAITQQTMAASLLNNGNGTFANPVEFQAVTAGRGEGVVLGNFVGDASLDLAVMSEDGDDFAILQGNGNGTFGAPVVKDNGSRNDAVAYDFDSDGDLDIVTTSGFGNQVEWYQNGNGTMTRTGYDFPGWNPYHLALGDFNGDGKMDVVSSGEHATNAGVNGAGFFGVYLNTDSGTQQPPPGGGGPSTPPPPAVGVDLATTGLNVFGKKTSFIGGVGKAGSLAKIKNVGDTVFKGAATVNWYASADGVIDASDTLITSRTKFVNLKAGKQTLFKAQLTMPDVSDGQYTILADVVQAAATDANAANNAAAAYGAYTIAKPFVDLSGWFKAAPTAIGAKGAFCTLQIKNDGNVKAAGPLNVKYYLSTDATLDGADTELASFSKFTNVQSGKTSVRKQKLTLPEGTASGQYYLIATLNSDNAILESVLNNNQAFSATPITV